MRLLVRERAFRINDCFGAGAAAAVAAVGGECSTRSQLRVSGVVSRLRLATGRPSPRLAAARDGVAAYLTAAPSLPVSWRITQA